MPTVLDPDESFAAEYRRFVSRALDRFEFFGVDPLGTPRRHAFDRGYFAPTLTRQDQPGTQVVSAGERADRELAEHRRAVVRGVAGSGKSTMLRWLGYLAAKAELRGEPTMIPFLLELGQFAGGALPDLEALVPGTLRQEMPAGWTSRMLRTGRALLLLDGLDELATSSRQRVERWVHEKLNVKPDLRCVVTTRPSVETERWWVDEDFQRFDLLPMSRYNIERFVRGWHTVARDDYATDTAGREWLAECEENLLNTLANRPALGGMSSNPLLCGLLCALHRERHHLPENRKEVYNAALDLLMVRWPNLRRRHHTSPQHGEPEPNGVTTVKLSPSELTKLLQRLAFWMVSNQELVLAPELALGKVTSYMAGLRDDDPAQVLRYLAHECGVLRQLPDGKLEFLHRTFRDHLAGMEVVDETNINLMLERAELPHWQDVVVMAGAHARPRERADILVRLVRRSRSEPRNRDALILVAAAVLEQDAVLPAEQPKEGDVRALVSQEVTRLIPPRSSATADKLAEVGSFVLDLLPGPDGLTDDELVLMVRTLARIAAESNPPGALEKILRLLRSAGTRHVVRRMIEELLVVWGRRGGYETYAQQVLSQVPLGGVPVSLQNPRRIEHIGYLNTITNLTVRDSSADLTPVVGLPNLRRLAVLRNINLHLAPLADSRTLRTLELHGCAALSGARPVDLSPIARMSLRRFVVAGHPANVDLADLPDVRLVSLRLSGGAFDNQPDLPAGLYVRHLTLHTRHSGRVRYAAVKGVRSLIIGWAPDEEDLAVLSAMDELRRLVLWLVPHGTLKPDLPGVDVLVVRAP